LKFPSKEAVVLSSRSEWLRSDKIRPNSAIAPHAPFVTFGPNFATESQLHLRFVIRPSDFVIPAMSTLAELPIGTDAIVQAMPTGRSCLTRLREMGIVPGTRIRVTRRAPLGEPIEISVRGSQLSMRNHEAAFIAIAPVAA